MILLKSQSERQDSAIFRVLEMASRCMGKLVDHGPGGVQKIVFPAGIITGQAGDFAVQGYGPED